MNPNEHGLTGPQVVFALYRPRDGKDEEFRSVLGLHIPTLRRLGLITDRAEILVKSRNGTYIEIFEWSTPEAAGQAHQHPEVAKVWEAMGQVADLPTLESLDEAKARFPNFAPVIL